MEIFFLFITSPPLKTKIRNSNIETFTVLGSHKLGSVSSESPRKKNEPSTLTGQAIPKFKFEAPRPQAGASRERKTVLIVPLGPAYKAGLAGHLPVKTSPHLHPLPSGERVEVRGF
jgi:hypothetical protein